MRITNKEELHEYNMALLKGAAKGLAGGAVVSGGWFWYWRKYYPSFRKWGMFPRTFMFMFPMLAGGITMMEVVTSRYEAAKSSDESRMIVEKTAKPFKDKIFDWGWEQRHKIVIGGWAGSLGLSYWWINRDKFMTRSQKIVQARMYAQALTVTVLLLSVLISAGAGTPSKDEEREEPDRINWKNVVADETKLREDLNIPLQLAEAEVPKRQHVTPTTHKTRF